MSKQVIPGGSTITITGDVLTFKGFWNATTNSPSLASGVGTTGDYYIVNVAGSTNLDGETDWQIGDALIFAGSVWNKLDNTSPVLSVNTLIGAVVLNGNNVEASHTAVNYTAGSNFISAHFLGIDTELGTLSSQWSLSGGVLTPVTATTVSTGVNNTLRTRSIRPDLGQELNITSDQTDGNLLLSSRGNVVVKIDSDSNSVSEFQIRDGLDNIRLRVDEAGNVTSDSNITAVSSLFLHDNTAAAKTLTCLTGAQLIIEATDVPNSGKLTFKSRDVIEHLADTQNVFADAYPHKFYTDVNGAVGVALDIELGSGGVHIIQGTLDMDSNQIEDLGTLSATVALGMILEATPIGASNTPAIIFSQAAAGGTTASDPIYSFRDSAALALLEVLQNGDIQVANGATIQSAAANSGMTLASGAVTFTGTTVTVDNTGSSTLDVQRPIVNTDAGFNGRVAFDDDIQLNKTGDTSIVSNRANAAGAECIIFDTINSITTTTAKLMSVKNSGAEKFHIAKNGGVGIGTSSTAVSVNSNGEGCIFVTNTAAPRTITLDADDIVTGRRIMIVDSSGGATTNNITIATEGAETINGATTATISVNYGSAQLISDGTNWFLI